MIWANKSWRNERKREKKKEKKERKERKEERKKKFLEERGRKKVYIST